MQRPTIVFYSTLGTFELYKAPQSQVKLVPNILTGDGALAPPLRRTRNGPPWRGPTTLARASCQNDEKTTATGENRRARRLPVPSLDINKASIFPCTPGIGWGHCFSFQFFFGEYVMWYQVKLPNDTHEIENARPCVSGCSTTLQHASSHTWLWLLVMYCGQCTVTQHESIYQSRVGILPTVTPVMVGPNPIQGLVVGSSHCQNSSWGVASLLARASKSRRFGKKWNGKWEGRIYYWYLLIIKIYIMLCPIL